MPYPSLNSQKALIWRIIHRDNLPWLLDNGVHCANSNVLDPNYVNIGNVELIDKRRHRTVAIAPHGTLSDYIPFYFTPFSPMMLNIRSGRNGVRQRANDEIAILVSSLPHLREQGIPFIYTNAHAYPDWTGYYSDLADLDKIDWPILQNRNFSRDEDDPRKMERYQAEALVHRHLPVRGLLGIICYTEGLKTHIEQQVQARELALQVFARPEWYFQ